MDAEIADSERAACLQGHDADDKPLAANQNVTHPEGTGPAPTQAVGAVHGGAPPSFCTYEPSPVRIAGAL
jgi:hypothetical protein